MVIQSKLPGMSKFGGVGCLFVIKDLVLLLPVFFLLVKRLILDKILEPPMETPTTSIPNRRPFEYLLVMTTLETLT